MSNQGGPAGSLVVDFAIDEATARERVARHMRLGLFTPSDVSVAGAINSVQALFVPARRVHAEASSNWTAESGAKVGNKVQWSAASGQHRGVYNDHVSIVASGPWAAAATAALRHVGAARPGTPELLARGERVPPSEHVEATLEKARKRVGLEETRACGSMIPGALKRNLKVNTSVDSVRAEDVWVPVYSGDFRYGSSTFTFAVDGVTGVVYGSRPTSPQRVLAAFGMFGLFIAVSFAWQSYQEYEGRQRVERTAHLACTASLTTAVDTMKSGDASGADAALAQSEPLCTGAAGQGSVQALADARVAIQEERARQDMELRGVATASFDAARSNLVGADAALEARDVDATSLILEKLRKAVTPYDRLDPKPEGLADLETSIADREAHRDALQALAGGNRLATASAKGNITAADAYYVEAAEAYSAGAEALAKVSASYGENPDVVKLKSELATGSRRVAKGAAAQRRAEAALKAKMDKEEREAEALSKLCGERPMPDGWDGGISAVESYMKTVANDPDSIDDENCTVPILTTSCWRTVCTIRGKNGFGALIATKQTFYLGRNPSIPSLSVVLAAE